MRIGVSTTDISRIEMIYSLGYDYAEINNAAANRKTPEEFSELKALARRLPEGYIYAANCLVPGDMRLTGPDVDYEHIRSFAHQSFAKLNTLGVRLIVFGSSGARMVPEGFSFDTAMEQLREVTRIFSDEAQPHGMKIAVEGLRAAECNIINETSEALTLARMACRSNVGVVPDYFHMMQNGESMRALDALEGMIYHAHLASPCMRSFPARHDGADYRSFFSALRRCGYDGAVTYEGKGDGDESTYREMLRYLREM